MIIFISDLHFVDETAGKQNIPTSAFELFLSNIKTHSEKTKNKDKEVKIVFRSASTEFLSFCLKPRITLLE